MFTIDKYSRVPIYEQIIEQVEMHIALGDLAPGEPAALRAQPLGGAVREPQHAAKGLCRAGAPGLCYSVPGNGRFISRARRKRCAPARQARSGTSRKRPARLAQAGIPLSDIVSAVTRAYNEAKQGGAT